MNSLDLVISKHMNSGERDRFIHNYGHALMAVHCGYKIQIDPDSEYHKISICKDGILDGDKNIALMMIYLSGAAAEEIYHSDYNKYTPSKNAIERFMKDIEYSRENIIKELENPTVKIYQSTLNNTFMNIPLAAIETYVNYAIINFGYIAKANNITSRQLMQKGLINYITSKTGNFN